MREIIMNKILKEIKNFGKVSDETSIELLKSFLNHEV